MNFRVVVRRAPQALLAVTVSACSSLLGDDEATARAELIRMPGVASSSAIRPETAAHTSPTVVEPWTSLVTVTSVRAPIVQVLLSDAGNDRFALYQCAGTRTTDCYVELNGPELQNLLVTAPASIPAATYEEIVIQHTFGCPTTERIAPIQATGTVSLGGATYFTSAAGGIDLTPPAEQITVNAGDCGVTFPINPPLVVSDGDAVTVRLYFDLIDMAYAGLPTASTGSLSPTGCTPFSSAWICLSWLAVVPAIGTTPPTIEHYHVNNAASFGLVFQAGSGSWQGGWIRPYLLENTLWNPGMVVGGSFSALTPAAGSTYRLEQHRLADGTTGAVFPNWQRATHTGTMTAQGRTTAYSAIRLP